MKYTSPKKLLSEYATAKYSRVFNELIKQYANKLVYAYIV